MWSGGKKKRKKETGRWATYFLLELVPKTTSAPAGDVSDVALALVPLPRVESKGALDELGRIPWGGMSGM